MYGDLMAGALALTGKGGTCVVTAVAPHVADRGQHQPVRAGHVAEGGPGRDLRRRATPASTSRTCSTLYKSGQLKLDELITQTYPLDQINHGYQDMRDGKNIRGVLVMS